MRHALLRIAAALLAVSLAAAGETPAPGTTPVLITTEGAAKASTIGLTIAGAAASAGTLTLRFTPEGGDTREIRLAVAGNATAAAVVDLLMPAMSAVISPEYRALRSGPAALSIGLGKKRAPFLLKSVGEPIPGLTLTLK